MRAVVYIFSLNLLAHFSFAQLGNEQRTVPECAAALKTKLWWVDKGKKNAEKYCEEYSQGTIDCAINQMQSKHLTYTKFEKAVKDCGRPRN